MGSMHVGIHEVFKSAIFWSAVGGWMVASLLKVWGNLRRTKRVDFQYLVSLGGMPSAHSAMVSGLATGVGLHEGFGSTIFVVTLAFAAVVMFDASTVRRATGQQARLLNQMVAELFKSHRLSEHKLKELLGHTRIEVFAGMLIGAVTAVFVALLAVSCGSVP